MGSTGGPNHDPDSVELPHPPGEDARPMEVGHKLKDPSAAPRGPTAPPEYIPATTKPPPGQGYTANLSSRPPSLPGDSKALSEILSKSSIVSHHRTLMTDTTFCLSPLAQVAAEILNEPSDLGWGPESQAQPDSFLWEDSDSEESQPEDPDTVSLLCASPRSGEPLENGQPPPRVRGPRSKTRGLRHKLLGLLPPKGENLKASLLGPVPVHPVPMERTEDGLQMRVACDEPQREQRFQPEGGNFVGVMSSSPFVLGNVVDARPLSTQPLSSISSCK